jgi:hypothetical protein
MNIGNLVELARLMREQGGMEREGTVETSRGDPCQESEGAEGSPISCLLKPCNSQQGIKAVQEANVSARLDQAKVRKLQRQL